MKFKPYVAVILTLCLTLCVLFSVNSYSETGKNTLEGPSAYVPEGRYEFGSVLEGTRLTHGFIIQNRGSAPLKILRVKPG